MGSLSCSVDTHYEWCKFYSPSRQECDFEWKRVQNNITMQGCALRHRVSFHGKYDDRQCGITFIATEGDTGIWKCEIEEYIILGTRGSGRVQTAEMNITVQSVTTTPPPPTTTTKTTTTQTTVTVSTEEYVTQNETNETYEN